MRRFLVWYFLLNKRLFKKYSFLIILCLVPLLVGAMNLVAREESGILQIALYLRNPEDEISGEIVQQLTEEDDVLQYVLCNTEAEARELLLQHGADAIWIFPEDLEKDIREAAANKRIGPVVTVVEREDNISLIFAREILCKTLYPFFSYEAYKDFIRDDIGLDYVSEEEFREAYNRTLVEGSLFQMEYLDGQPEEQSNYLLAPMRGLLAIWLVLCGFAASMYFIQDEQNGVFSRIAASRRLRMAFVMHAVLLSDAMVVLLIACKLAGVFTLLHREILCAVLFVGCTLMFCNLIRLVCRTMERLGSCIPILLMGMLILSPVFLDVKSWRAIQYLLPPYYYLKSIHSLFYVYGMVIYIVVMGIFCVLISRWQNRKMK